MKLNRKLTAALAASAVSLAGAFAATAQSAVSFSDGIVAQSEFTCYPGQYTASVQFRNGGSHNDYYMLRVYSAASGQWNDPVWTPNPGGSYTPITSVALSGWHYVVYFYAHYTRNGWEVKGEPASTYTVFANGASARYSGWCYL